MIDQQKKLAEVMARQKRANELFVQLEATTDPAIRKSINKEMRALFEQGFEQSRKIIRERMREDGLNPDEPCPTCGRPFNV